MKHTDIVRKLTEINAIDYKKLGSAVGELAPALVDSEGMYGMVVGKHMILACMMPADRQVTLNDLTKLAGVADEVKGR